MEKSDMKKGIVVICNLDTRGEDILFVRDLIRGRGHNPILLDFSMEEPPPVPGDIRCEEVASRGGLPIETVREYYRTNREAATNNQINGAAAIVTDLLNQGKVHGVIGIGGATSSLVSTGVMQQLPFGMPKLMATPIASLPRYTEKCIGTHDITMHHTVLDVVKMNPLLKAQIINAVGAICGMVEMTQGPDFTFDRPVIAISAFGFAEVTAQASVRFLEDAGFVPVVCHAQGKGDKAMDDMIDDGLFQGVIDLCTGGITENLFDGNRNPGSERLMAAVRKGVPAVLAPCGLDFLSYGGRPDKLAERKGRAQFVQDSFRIQVRTSAEELRQAAEVIAERLNQSRGPFSFLIPRKGWSSIDQEGKPLYDPEANAAFVNRLREKLHNKEAIQEVDLHLYTPEFARAAVDEFVRLYSGNIKSQQRSEI
ncbi:Tm-1-like ATP-binding domain-containing protein [Desulfuromonas sp. TF]|uniref:Tm-1-like ATP-binding domain-containing protein n=1 Tax=Desulfuromonas sp. TF TaxID=1232410 RepID=UPI0003F83CDA|nr:Tm-1-like ATP-binding domain-containing protein [Desulfuromonas sp. TF]